MGSQGPGRGGEGEGEKERERRRSWDKVDAKSLEWGKERGDGRKGRVEGGWRLVVWWVDWEWSRV